MAKFIDGIFTIILLFVVCLIALSFAIDNFLLCAAISLTLSLIMGFAMFKLRSGRKKTLKNSDIHKILLIHGNDYLAEILSAHLKDETAVNLSEHAFSLSGSKLVYCAYKGGNSGTDDIVKSYKLAKESGSVKCYFVCNTIDRKAVLFSGGLGGVNYKFICAKQLIKLLKKLLPLQAKEKHTRSFYTVKTIFGTVFSRRNGKHFILAAAITFLTSFITPLKLYYRIIALVSLGLAVLCFTGAFHSGAETQEFKSMFDLRDTEDDKQVKK